MARLVVLASGDLADGFRLAGATAIAAGPGEADGVLRRVVAEPAVGVVLVTEDLWLSLAERVRDGLERLSRPLVLQVPVGELARADGRRAAIEEMLQRAIGYRTAIVRAGEPAGAGAAAEADRATGPGGGAP